MEKLQEIPVESHGFEHLKRILRSEDKLFHWGLYDNKMMVFPTATEKEVETIKTIFSKHNTPMPEAAEVQSHVGSKLYAGPTNFRMHPDMELNRFAFAMLFPALKLSPPSARPFRWVTEKHTVSPKVEDTCSGCCAKSNGRELKSNSYRYWKTQKGNQWPTSGTSTRSEPWRPESPKRKPKSAIN